MKVWPPAANGHVDRGALEEAKRRIFEYTMLYLAKQINRKTLDKKLTTWIPMCGLFGVEEMKIGMPIDPSYDDTDEYRMDDGEAVNVQVSTRIH